MLSLFFQWNQGNSVFQLKESPILWIWTAQGVECFQSLSSPCSMVLELFLWQILCWLWIKTIWVHLFTRNFNWDTLKTLLYWAALFNYQELTSPSQNNKYSGNIDQDLFHRLRIKQLILTCHSFSWYSISSSLEATKEKTIKPKNLWLLWIYL